MFRLVYALAFAGLVQGLLKHPQRSIPPNWKLDSQLVNAEQQVNLMIALHAKDAKLLQQTILEVSTPGSARFRKYLSNEQIAEIVAPAQEQIDRVLAWLRVHGITQVEVPAHRDWVRAQTTVGNVEKLLDCRIVRYRNMKSGATTLNALSTYTIPEELTDIVDFVAGLHDFPFGRFSATKVQSDNLGVAQRITPATIYDNYGTPKDKVYPTMLGSNAVVEFGALANFSPDDLQQFFSDYANNLEGETCSVIYGNNNGDGKTSMEANLDVQYIMSVGVFVSSYDYKITGLEDIETLMLEYSYIVNNQTDPPLAHSISYGEYGGSYNNDTEQRFDYELQKMGLKGISVLLASGDNGVGCGEHCSSQEFDFPSCPHITMVGATYIDSDNVEKGATLSSGGFSKDFYRPSWQATQVDNYLNTNDQLPTKTYYYVDGRAYPDVSAYGQNVMIVSGGQTTAVSGTSCSAPIFAGVISLINNELMQQGESPLGFLNPWLYSNQSMFTDITEGSNPYSCCEGFYAQAGWDPVTGMGTPLYQNMLDAAFAALEA